MRIEKFKIQIDRLTEMFQPKNWTASLEGAYFDVVKQWSGKEFEDVVDTSLKRYEYMPKPKSLQEVYDEKARQKKPTLTFRPRVGCGKCDDGFVPFTAEKNGLEYDRICACTCEAGRRRQRVKYGGRSIRTSAQVFHEEEALPF